MARLALDGVEHLESAPMSDGHLVDRSGFAAIRVVVAEAAARLGVGLLRRHAARVKLADAFFDVEVKLIVELSLDARSRQGQTEEPPKAAAALLSAHVIASPPRARAPRPLYSATIWRLPP